MHVRIWTGISVLVAVFLLAFTPADAQEVFGVEMRAALREDNAPAFGASETVNPLPTPVSPDQAGEPYNAGEDRQSGFMAAGAAGLASVAVLFLFMMILTSRHHEQT